MMAEHPSGVPLARAVIDALPNPLMIVDGEERICLANSAACQMSYRFRVRFSAPSQQLAALAASSTSTRLASAHRAWAANALSICNPH
jgi:transcriptional regulator of aromatic amino acid metabolism